MAGRVGMLCLLFFATTPAFGAAPALLPEQLLAADTIFYLRYDGIEAHRKAFDGSVVGELMRDELGDFFDYVTNLTRDSLGPVVLKDRILNGEPAKRLQSLRSGFQHAPEAVRCLGQNGFVIGVEIINVLGPRVQVTIVFPEAGREKNGGAVPAALYLLAMLNDMEVTERNVAGRTVYQCDPGERLPVNINWWQEGPHVVLILGTEKPERTIELLAKKRRNILENLLFKEVRAFKDYETIAHGFVDLEKCIKLVHLLPLGNQVIDRLGADNLKWATFRVGFEGRDMRTTLAVRAPGKRTGLLAMLTDGRAVELDRLPPLPPDAASFHVLNLNPAEVFDLIVSLTEAAAALSGEEERQRIHDTIKALDGRLGVSVRNDVLGNLGSQFVVYNSPLEGPFATGLALIAEVKDEAKLKRGLDALLKSLPLVLGETVTVRKQACAGTEIFTTHVAQEVFFLSPTFAVHRGRLVIGLYPQTVRGYLRRAEGKMSSWKSAPLAAAAAEARKGKGKIVGLSMNDPRPPLQQLCPYGPILFGLLDGASPGSFDVGRLPHVQALTEPLYPSMSVVTDDGDTLRINTRGALGLPFLEPPGADGLFLAYLLLQVL